MDIQPERQPVENYCMLRVEEIITTQPENGFISSSNVQHSIQKVLIGQPLPNTGPWVGLSQHQFSQNLINLNDIFSI